MSDAVAWHVWRPFFATLAVGTALIFVAALMMQRWTRSMAWQRTIWQVVFLSLGLLAILELSGVGSAVWSWLPQTSRSEVDGQLLLQAKVIGEPDLPVLLADHSRHFHEAPVSQVHGPPPAQQPVWWPGALWFFGFGVLLAWTALARLVFLVLVPRRAVRDEFLLARMESLARRLGTSGRVRVTETRGLVAPGAFGVFRQGMSLPERFSCRFPIEQQDTMLAHELAHLSARDPLWHALADGVTALLWWHPLAWWAKRNLRAASEAAADEASMLVENGPS